MSDKIQTALRRLWEDRTTGANSIPTKGTYEVNNGLFRLILNSDSSRWPELIKANGVPSTAQQFIAGDTITLEWPSISDQIYAAGGYLDQALDGYELRAPQLHASRLWERAIQMGEVATVEAGTGTGKSFIGVGVPLMMGKRIIISTSNKALQAQLMKKDLPFLFKTLPGCSGKKAVVVQGRNNYVCMNKVEDQAGGHAALPNVELAQWYKEEKAASFAAEDTGTYADFGNLENYPHEITLEDKAAVTTDDCLRKQCPFYAECFYYKARAQRADADVIVCNHSLLALDHLHPMAQILPPASAKIVDEAHQLADYVRNAVGIEISTDRINKAVNELAQLDSEETKELIDALNRCAGQFFHAVDMLTRFNTIDKQIPVKADVEIEAGTDLALAINELANHIWNNEDIPNDGYEVSLQNKANRYRKLGNRIANFSRACPEGYVRWFTKDDGITCVLTPWDVSAIIGSMAGYHQIMLEVDEHEEAPVEAEKPTYTKCARCGRTLTAESVFILGDLPFGPVCIKHVDLLDEADQVPLADWLGRDHTPPQATEKADESSQKRSGQPPMLFMSATLATPKKIGKWGNNVVRTMELFLKDSGIPDALQMISASPFDYESNCTVYIPPKEFPAPNAPQWDNAALDEMDKLVRMSQGGAFLLFTSNRMLNAAYDALAMDFELAGYEVFKQGTLGKLEIIRRFKEHGNAVLFATKTFFEGVDIPGEALRLVVIDKMPYEAPNPINNAQAEALRRELAAAGCVNENDLKWTPYWEQTVPKMCQTLQQAHGRGIRTNDDKAVVALLDSRARKPGAYPFVASVLAGRWVHADYMVESFLRDMRSPQKFGDLSPVQQLVNLADVAELPF